MADGTGNGIEIPVLTVDTLYVTGAINPGPAGSEAWDDSTDNSGTVNGLAARWVEAGSQTRDYTNNVLLMTGHALAGGEQVNPATLLQDAPAAPYSVICPVIIDNGTILLCFADVAGTTWAAGLQSNGHLAKYYTTSPTLANISIYSSGLPDTIWLRIDDDGANLSFYTSTDGKTWGSAIVSEDYATGGLSGAPVSFGLAISHVDSFSSANPSTPAGTFGPVTVDDGSGSLVKIGNLTNVSDPATVDNIPVYGLRNGEPVVRDSGIPITDILTVEQVQDIVGAMAEGGTQSGIVVTYDDTGAAINFEVIPNTRYLSDYDNGTAYAINDIVVEAGAFYICILASTGHTPPNATYWLPWGGSDGGGVAADTTYDNTTSGLIATDVQAAIDEIVADPKVMDLFNHHVDAGNTGTGETDGYSDTLAAGQLATNDDKITIKEFGTSVTSAGTATRQWKKKFDGNTIFDSTALLLSTSGDWSLVTEIIRVSSTVIRYAVTLEIDGAPLPIYKSVGELTGLTLSGTNVMLTTLQAAGVGAATNDIVETMGNVFYTPNGAVGMGVGSGGGRTLISEITPTGTGRATWSSIPGFYKKLIIEYAIKSTQTGAEISGLIELNGDSDDSHYGFISTRTNYAGTAHDYGSTPKFSQSVCGSTVAAGEFSIGKIEIIQYASNDFYKVCLAENSDLLYYDGYRQMERTNLTWLDTSPVTQIDVVLSAGDYAANSVLRLYGEN